MTELKKDLINPVEIVEKKELIDPVEIVDKKELDHEKQIYLLLYISNDDKTKSYEVIRGRTKIYEHIKKLVENIDCVKSKVIANGVDFKEALYLGSGEREVYFESVDKNKPAKFYFNSATAHRNYPDKKITKADAVLVARGGIGNPEFITNLNKAFNGEKYNEIVDFDRQISYLKEYSRDLVKERGEKKA